MGLPDWSLLGLVLQGVVPLHHCDKSDLEIDLINSRSLLMGYPSKDAHLCCFISTQCLGLGSTVGTHLVNHFDNELGLSVLFLRKSSRINVWPSVTTLFFGRLARKRARHQIGSSCEIVLRALLLLLLSHQLNAIVTVLQYVEPSVRDDRKVSQEKPKPYHLTITGTKQCSGIVAQLPPRERTSQSKNPEQIQDML
eukprot:6331502-Amphidinium_carterae.1